jgi:hypothetical protein
MWRRISEDASEDVFRGRFSAPLRTGAIMVMMCVASPFGRRKEEKRREKVLKAKERWEERRRKMDSLFSIRLSCDNLKRFKRRRKRKGNAKAREQKQHQQQQQV